MVSGIRVLVAGASIAGPALAHWLRRRGAEVTVVERAPGLRPGGQAVDARGVAKEVIVRMGLDAAVRAARTDTAGAYTVDADGNVLETFRAATGRSARTRSAARRHHDVRPAFDAGCARGVDGRCPGCWLTTSRAEPEATVRSGP